MPILSGVGGSYLEEDLKLVLRRIELAIAGEVADDSILCHEIYDIWYTGDQVLVVHSLYDDYVALLPMAEFRAALEWALRIHCNTDPDAQIERHEVVLSAQGSDAWEQFRQYRLNRGFAADPYHDYDDDQW